MPSKPNPLIAALAAERVQIGTWLTLVRNPAVLTLLKSAGLDYARVDMEHTGISIETVADFAVLARALDFPLVVRPPDGNREWITRLLDAGIWALHIPQVDTPEIAYAAVRAAYYAPRGLRGMSFVGPASDFSTGSPATQLAFQNEQIHLTVMLESAAAFRHLDEIVGLPGIDAVTLGPSDLAQELGVFGTPDQARVIDEHRDQLIAAAQRHGKQVAMLVQTLDEAERWIKAGVKLIAYASDVAILMRGFEAAVARLRPA